MLKINKYCFLILLVSLGYLSNNYAAGKYILQDGKLVKNSEIFTDNVLYEDENVCILDPTSKRGVLVFHGSKYPDLCNEDLLNGDELFKIKGIKISGYTDRSVIYFRAPYAPADEGLDMEKYYPGGTPKANIAVIRVDPSKTYVFSSQIRIHMISLVNTKDYNNQINNSKKTMLEYFDVLRENAKIKYEYGKKFFYNLFSSKKVAFSSSNKPEYPLDENTIEYNSEILVKLPYIPKEWFVFCKILEENP